MPKQSKATLGFSLSVLPLALRAEVMYRRLPHLRLPSTSLPGADGEGRLPDLSIIVPARNEAPNLRRLLPSLQALCYPGCVEIIVVDDHSRDETAAVAAGCGARVITAPDLPPDWLGKPHACHLGAQVARGDWLLFTDADTWHAPGSAAVAVGYAEQHTLDGLSIFLQQETRGFLDRAVLMVAFAGLFAGLRRKTDMLNGQYLLLRRATYEQSGGFSAVRREMMEDLAFGRLLSEEGFLVPVMRGEELATVRMYRDWRHLWRGMMRLGAGSLRWSGLGALVAAVFITGVMMPLWILLFERHQLKEHPRLWWIWGASLGGFLPWSRRFAALPYTSGGCPPEGGRGIRQGSWRDAGRGALLAPFAAAFVQLAAVWGFLARLLGRGISWKERKV